MYSNRLNVPSVQKLFVCQGYRNTTGPFDIRLGRKMFMDQQRTREHVGANPMNGND